MLGNSLVVGQRTLKTFPREELLTNFLNSRKQGISPQTTKFYKGYLTRAISVIGLHTTHNHINSFLTSLNCSLGGKHAYYRSLKTYYKWLYSPRASLGLNYQDNPMLLVDAPKREKRLLPSITQEHLTVLESHAECQRDRVMLNLLFDSGMRLSEITSVRYSDIDWNTQTISVIGKGNKQRRAPFTKRTGELIQDYLCCIKETDNIWGLTIYGIQQMLERLEKETGIKCNPHAFRRGFACNLHRKGLSTLDIMHLGGWSDLSMVLRYTHSITFDDCLSHYQVVFN